MSGTSRAVSILALVSMFIGGVGCSASQPSQSRRPEPGARGVCSSDAECGPGQACCYPCGVEGCENLCMDVQPGRGCPEIP